jgi:Fe-S-cluster formation regulator IscX/YfhJ
MNLLIFYKLLKKLRQVKTLCVLLNYYTDNLLSTNVRKHFKTSEVKETTDTASSASFLDLYLEFDDSGQLSTKIYDKRDDFNFKIINFPNMCSTLCVLLNYYTDNLLSTNVRKHFKTSDMVLITVGRPTSVF